MNLEQYLPSQLFGPHGTVYAILLGAGFIAVWLGFTVVWGMTRPPNNLTRIILNTVAPGDPKAPRAFNSRRVLTYMLIPLFVGVLVRGFFFTIGAVKFTEDEIRVLDSLALMLAALVGIGAYKDVKLNAPPTQINSQETNVTGGPNTVVSEGEING